jgi:glucose/arabinose dehydrogenase
MLPRGSGSIFFTGATAGVKGFARSSVFAMGKFALRGLAQSLARELGPAGIHVVHFVMAGAPVDVLTGFLNSHDAALGRPVAVAIDKQGALLVGDDVGDTIWRVSAAQPGTPHSGTP